ncbi:ArnT family glycosyltransferase [Elusimicrobiota bacterium]
MDLIIFLLITAAIMSLGKIITGRIIKLQADEHIEKITIYWGIGAGVLAFAIGFSGIAGLNRLLWLFVVIALAAYGVITADIKRIKSIRDYFGDLDSLGKLLLTAFAVCSLLNIISSYIPALQSDALQYHLLIPRYYMAEGRIFNLSQIVRYSVFPQLMEYIFLLGMLLKSDAVARLLHTGFGVFTALAVFSFTGRYFHKKTALLAMLLFTVSPVVRHLSGTGMIDLGLAFYFIMSGYVFMRWMETAEKKWLILFAVFCGFSFSVKYTGILSLLWLPCGLIFKKLINKDFMLKDKLKDTIIPILLFLLIISPWLIKNYIYTGNPVSPFCYKIFGGSNWNGYIDKNWKSHLKGGVKTENIKEYLASKLGFLKKIFSHTPLNIFALLILFGRLKKAGPAMIFFLTAMLYIIIGAFIMPEIYRFVLPGLAALSIVTACIYVKIGGIKGGGWMKAVKMILLLFIIGGIGNRIYEVFVPVCRNWRVIISLETKEDFLKRKINCYSLTQYINSSLSWNDKILSLNETRGYYFNSKFLVSHEVVQGSIVHTSKDIEEIISSIRSEGIDYVLVNRNRYFSAHQRQTVLLKKKNINKYLKLVASGDECFLYKVRSNA